MRAFGERVRRYLSSAACAAAISIFVLFINDFVSAGVGAEGFGLLSDAFAVSGSVLVSAWALILVESTGAFDMIGYAFRRGLGTLVPFGRAADTSFYDYKCGKKARRLSEYAHLLWIGIACLVLGGVFLALYFRALPIC